MRKLILTIEKVHTLLSLFIFITFLKLFLIKRKCCSNKLKVENKTAGDVNAKRDMCRPSQCFLSIREKCFFLLESSLCQLLRLLLMHSRRIIYV